MTVLGSVLKFIAEYNPVTIVADINKAGQAAKDLQKILPELAGLLPDLKQAYTDRSDTAKLDADIAKLLTDATAAAAALGTLFSDI